MTVEEKDITEIAVNLERLSIGSGVGQIQEMDRFFVAVHGTGAQHKLGRGNLLVVAVVKIFGPAEVKPGIVVHRAVGFGNLRIEIIRLIAGRRIIDDRRAAQDLDILNEIAAMERISPGVPDAAGPGRHEILVFLIHICVDESRHLLLVAQARSGLGANAGAVDGRNQ